MNERKTTSRLVEPPPKAEFGRKVVNLRYNKELQIGNPSWRTADIGIRFGIPLHGTTVAIVGSTAVTLAPGRIVLLLGPSGSGKSSALEAIERQFAAAPSVHRISFPPDAAIVDRIAPWAPLPEVIGTLTGCGLGEPHWWVRPFDVLSEGEKFRARLARAVALQSRVPTNVPLLCDEFCSLLHRRVAKAVAFNLHKLAVRRGICAVVACSHEDLVPDLQPHAIVRFRGAGRCDVEERPIRANRSFSLRRRLTISQGNKSDYDAFAAMHYRAGDELGFVDKIFVLRERSGGEALGIVVYAHGPLELALRNQAADGVFMRNPRKLNESLRILRRLVIHPDVRGCGLGRHLVRKTLPLVGTEYVECLAAMGEYNPVFERAGMKRIGQCEISPKRRAALEALRAVDVDPHGLEFVTQVCRKPKVRRIVANAVRDWYTATTGGGEHRVERQSPQFLAQLFRNLITSRPVYYLWKRRIVKSSKRRNVERLKTEPFA